MGACLLSASGVNARGEEITEGESEDGFRRVGAIPAGRESGLEAPGSLVIKELSAAFHSSGGTGTLSASESAMVMAEALEKRSSGSLAMLFRMTADNSGEISGLKRAGDLGAS